MHAAAGDSFEDAEDPLPVSEHVENAGHLADVLGEKKVTLATQRQAEELTGLQSGGISALALTHKRFQVVLDNSSLDFPAIAVSAGQRGLNVRLAPEDFLEVTAGITAPIARPIDPHENSNP